MQVFGALPTSSDVYDVDRLLWAGLQALGGIGKSPILLRQHSLIFYN